ncbi:tumor necrosis factor alpha-induced protein 2-like isoform X2 [Simochromis diagramma]|uniref:tumor necrosis factor alpha-induced protein 2-like isoform X2 n=1 Tax=Simochromis diagramma TaxID=43689 RepID=UPI001A7EC453|nr:tumor necrosis factor alpha-induced protein 2-like isoform X2 [Simochromis diagramma]
MSHQRSKGSAEESGEEGGARSKLPRLKIPSKIWKNRKLHNNNEGDEVKQVQVEQEEQLEESSRRLIEREEDLFSYDSVNEEEEDELHKDFEALQLKLWMAINDTFTPSSSAGELKVLRSAMVSIQQQEAQDRRWRDCQEERVPRWRPQKCLSIHNILLQNMVEGRIKEAAKDTSGGTDRLSSPVKRQVCRVGRCVKEDLLTVVRRVKNCYPPHMDIMNLYAGLYHQEFSAHLTQLTAAGLDDDDCSYLLSWVNQYYPHEILEHTELDGQIKVPCLGSLLPQDELKLLEEQYLTHKEEKVKLWLNTALKKEQENWLSGRTPEIIDGYYFSCLAVDVIQVMTGSLSEFSCAIKDKRKAQRLTVQLENFMYSYVKCVEEFVKGNHGNVRSVIKAQLVCEQQLRDYITAETGNLSQEQKHGCLNALSALRDCGYRYLTCSLHVRLKKVCWSQLWMPRWLNGSLPLVDLLLDSLSQQLVDLTDLKPVCRELLLCDLHQDVVLKYVKRMMKTKMKSKEQQTAGAQRMIEDAKKINSFFSEEGCSKASWLCEIVCKLAEILRLQDPASIQLELVTLARNFPDLSGAHVSALLSLKIGLSAADTRSIRRSVEENRHGDVSTNYSPPFFSKVKVKWIDNKMNQMGL